MYALSQNIREEGRKEGRNERKVQIILNMYQKGLPLERIAEFAASKKSLLS